MRTMSRRRPLLITRSVASAVVAFAPWSGTCRGATLPAPTASTLMLLAFPDWSQDNPVSQYVYLPYDQASKLIAPMPARAAFDSKYKVTINPLIAASLDGSHAVLLTSGMVDAQNLGVRCDYSCLYATGAYLFTAGADGWKLSKSINVVSLDWASDYPRHAKISAWPGHELIASFRLNNNAQGESTDDIYLFGLLPDKVVPLIHTSIAEDNEGGPGLSDNIACGDVLKQKFVAPNQASLSTDTRCYSADGSWSAHGNTIVFEFHGLIRATDGQGRLLPLKSWRKTAILMLQRNGTLKLIFGHLPNYVESD